MGRNLFAYTAPGTNYPNYMALNRNEDGSLVLDARGPATADGKCGATIQVPVPREEAKRFIHALIDGLIPTDAA